MYVWKILEQGGAQRDTPRQFTMGSWGPEILGPGASGRLVSGLSGEIQFLLQICIMFHVQGFSFDVGVSMDLSLGGATGRGRGCTKPTFLVQQPTTASA